ncbi:MAG: radical SAM protein [Candidatus Altiarchaeia archaeon]
MASDTDVKDAAHPCFNRNAAGRFGRLHLAVAPRCNIQCRYCDRKYGCVNENRPGVTYKILKPEETVKYAKSILTQDKRIKVIGIAGPGDPLANEETIETLRLIAKNFPDHTKCLSTNGLALPENVENLKEAGLDNLTVTVNTMDERTGAQIYRYVSWKGIRYVGREAAKLLWDKQREGIARAIDAGIRVKVNTVYIPGINDSELVDLSQEIGSLGVRLMNLMPLIPLAEFVNYPRPGKEELDKKRALMEEYVPQMDWCRQCRADAAGLLNEDAGGCDLRCSGASPMQIPGQGYTKVI